jgi:acetyl esterase
MMTDYSKLIDAETWAFIDKTNGQYPPDAVDLDITGQRAVYDRMCAAFHVPHPANVMHVDETLPGNGHAIPVRRYESTPSPSVTVVYFHGGGFVVGGLHSHDDVCAEICGRTGYRVVSVDYRLCPEHVHPAAFDDALAAFRHVRDRYDHEIVLAGDSAGGNLAAAVAHATRGERAARGVVLVYPGLGGNRNAGSYVTHAEAPMLRAADVDYYAAIRAGGRDVSADPTYAPLLDRDFSRLPPTVIVSAECDPISDDGRDYRDALRRAGGKAEWFNERGLVHGYLRARHMSARARDSFDRIVGAIDALGKGSWPY